MNKETSGGIWGRGLDLNDTPEGIDVDGGAQGRDLRSCSVSLHFPIDASYVSCSESSCLSIG